jgi:hypothetical protein
MIPFGISLNPGVLIKFQTHPAKIGKEVTARETTKSNFPSISSTRLHFVGDSLNHLDFLGNGIYQGKLYLREKNGKRDPWKSTAGTGIEHPGAWLESDKSGYGERVQYMMQIKIIDILSGNHVDLFVPRPVKSIKPFELRELL